MKDESLGRRRRGGDHRRDAGPPNAKGERHSPLTYGALMEVFEALRLLLQGLDGLETLPQLVANVRSDVAERICELNKQLTKRNNKIELLEKARLDDSAASLEEQNQRLRRRNEELETRLRKTESDSLEAAMSTGADIEGFASRLLGGVFERYPEQDEVSLTWQQSTHFDWGANSPFSSDESIPFRVTRHGVRKVAGDMVLIKAEVVPMEHDGEKS